VRTLVFGLLAGLTASALRAPLGIELVQLTSTPASVAVAYRAVPFLLLAVALFAGRSKAGEGFDPIRFLIGSCLGLASHGLLIGATPDSHRLVVLVCAVAAACLWFTAQGDLGAGLEGTEESGEGPTATPLAHAFMGAGIAIALEGIFRHLRLLGAGAPTDDSVFAGVLSLLILLGAACFKSVARSTTTRTLCLAGGSLSALISLRLLSGVSTVRGLDRYLRWFDLDTSLRGTLSYDALLAGVIFIIPAFLIGAGLQGVRRRSNLAGLSAGAAIGLLISPHFLTYLILQKTETTPPFLAHESSASQLIPWGAALAFTGAALHLVRHPGIARWAALSFFFVAPLPFVAPPDPVRILAPWQLRTPQPIEGALFDTPEGLLTIEPTEYGVEAVTLDRRLISPSGARIAADRLQLEASIGLLPRALRSEGFSVLLLGQLTPERARTLTELGARTIDRTAAWHKAMPLLEYHLFRSDRLPEGSPISPNSARANISDDEYDIVIAPSIEGQQPTTRNFASGPNTRSVVWFDAAGGTAHLALGERVILSTATLEDLSIGVVRGVSDAELSKDELFFLTGEGGSRGMPWASLVQRLEEREQRARAAMGQRLAEANSSGVAALVSAGLGAHFSAQERSSPWDRLAERIELSDEALKSWCAAASASPLARPTREVFGAAARVLQGKRAVTEIYAHIEPVLMAHPAWAELVAVLSYADLEALDPEMCIHRVEAALALELDEPLLHVLVADALVQLGRASDAVEHLHDAYAELPNNDGVRARLAMALVRAGDEEGRAMINDLLHEAELDESNRWDHLRPYLVNGPLPSAPSGYTPLMIEAHADGHEGHGH